MTGDAGNDSLERRWLFSNVLDAGAGTDTLAFGGGLTSSKVYWW